MKRNIEKINQLADRIEKCEDVEDWNHKPELGPSFTMSDEQYECGAPACIMGHFFAMEGHNQSQNPLHVFRRLGISPLQGNELCFPKNSYAHYKAPHSVPESHITKAHAVAVLRNLAATGEVDWKIGSST